MTRPDEVFGTRKVRAAEAEVPVVTAVQELPPSTSGPDIDDQPIAQEQPWERGSLAASSLREDERDCLSGGWEGEPIRYWDLDSLNRSTGAEACFQGVLPGGGESSDGKLHIEGIKKGYGLARPSHRCYARWKIQT